MGYEQNIVIVEKSKADAIRNMNMLELKQYLYAKCKTEDRDELIGAQTGDVDPESMFWFPAITELLGEKRVYSFGQYYANAGEIENLGEHFFTDKLVCEAFQEEDPYLIGKDAIENAIEYYRHKTSEYYKSLMLSDDEYKEYCLTHLCSFENQVDRIMHAISKKYKEWTCPSLVPYALNGPNCINSWDIEYEIFELVDMYRTTNWDKECCIFFGH